MSTSGALPKTFPAAVGLVVPTHNAAQDWPALHSSLLRQGIPPQQILIIDSDSTDGTCTLARQCGYTVVCVPQETFGHGVTRQTAISHLPGADLLLYMTQDAVLADEFSVRNLCSALNDQTVGAAFGRQLPRVAADPIESHARLFNYPAESHVRTFESRHQLGIKAAFFSNSFAVYRRAALDSVGGFPADVILGEDSIVAARLLMHGWKIVYRADALVIHSHRLTLRQEFSRYFDIGVFHARQPWLLETFGTAGKEGKRFVQSEFRFLCRSAPWLVPVALLRTALKSAGYTLGKMERRLPLGSKKKMSAHPNFWP